MSRITGKDAANLIEAYNSLYAPQEEVELTEEQVQEDFENWVNSLVEEGHDLSEYTWEDMYEAYIGEDIKSFADRGGLLGAAQRAFARSGTEQGKAQNRAAVGRFFGGINQAMVNRIKQNVPQTTAAKPQPTAKYKSSSDGKLYKNYNDALAARNSRLRSAQQPGTSATMNALNNPGVQNRFIQDKPTPTRTPAAPARTPATTPTAPAPKAAPAAPAASSIERRIPTSAELKQAQQLRTTGANLTGTGALAPKPAAAPAAPAATSTPTPAAEPKPNLQQSIRNRRLNMDLDLFDIIKGHLLDEGYADTEEAALKIMANMSEEWKQSIVEASEEDKQRLLNYEVRYYQKRGGMPPDPEKRRQLRDAARRLPPA